MARIATPHIHFVLLSTLFQAAYVGARTEGTTFREYAVEVRQGTRSWTLGRISGAVGSNGSASWMGLPIGADAWTCRHATRKAALAAFLVREDWQTVRAQQDAALYALTA